ncbi:MAG: ROK family protein [Thermoflexales bacterium]|nr:ROK family protein [Thermoflexales bacterium]
MEILGIDIGGTGIKGALVEVETGRIAAERYRLLTPQPSVPKAVVNTVAKVTRHFEWKGPLGCTFPAVVRHGVVYSAANVDKSWIGVNGQELLERKTGCPVVLLNDADAAGIAEMELGAGKGQSGVVIVLTLGTGIGSAVFIDGRLLPNTELGHIEVGGQDAELRASDRARQEKAFSWKKWAKHLNRYMGRLEMLLSPDLFIVGGGVSKKHEHFLPLLETVAPIVPARLLNEAGIVGAAMAARNLAVE